MKTNNITPICMRFGLTQKQLLTIVGLSTTYSNLKGEPTAALIESITHAMPFVTEGMIRGSESLNTIKDVRAGDDQTMDINQRMNALTYHYQLTLQHFCEQCGIHQSSISNIKRGSAVFTDNIINQIITTHDEISREWLTTGKQPMFTDGRNAPLTCITNNIEVVYLGRQYSITIPDAEDITAAQTNKSAKETSAKVVNDDTNELTDTLCAAIDELNSKIKLYESKLENLAKREEAIAMREDTIAEKEGIIASQLDKAISLMTRLQLEGYNRGLVAEDRLSHPDIK